jgi:hypothetical protein
MTARLDDEGSGDSHSRWSMTDEEMLVLIKIAAGWRRFLTSMFAADEAIGDAFHY